MYGGSVELGRLEEGTHIMLGFLEGALEDNTG